MAGRDNHRLVFLVYRDGVARLRISAAASDTPIYNN